MSGVEAAGLALAVLPLLVATAEHYEQCLRPFERYKNFAKEVHRYQHRLALQKVIFRNQCRSLLEEVIDHDVVCSMLNARGNHPSWSDRVLEGQLCQLLSDSKDVCIDTIELIAKDLQDIETESQDFENAIEKDSSDRASANPLIGKAWRRRVKDKLRFSFSRPRLAQGLSSLRSLNEDFRELSSQILRSRSRPSQSKTERNSLVSANQEVERYGVIGKASQQVYEALGKACTKHTEHQAQFCVEVEQAIIHQDQGARVRFNMGYTHLHLAGAADQNDLTWFVVDSTSGDVISPGKMVDAAGAGIDNAFTKTLKRQIEPTTAPNEKKVKKSVRFQSSAPLTTCKSFIPQPTLTDATLSNDMVRKDFCDFLKRRFRDQICSGECVGVLEHGTMYKNYVYSSPLNQRLARRQAISLNQLITTYTAKNQTVGRVSLYDRLHLARTLAVAVLQYHSTPWLKQSWRSNDVYFFTNGNFPANEISSLTSPHLNVKVKGPCGQVPQLSTSASHGFARNPLLFSLGVVLLEIAYAATLSTLQSPVDLENGRENRHTEFFAARRLAKSAKTDMGGRYHQVVEKLVECDFGCGTDLGNPQLQAAFHSEVICPLAGLEQKFRDFVLTDQPTSPV
ncbi:hypothetical protein ACLMJK_002455 [Lecanora helva]